MSAELNLNTMPGSEVVKLSDVEIIRAAPSYCGCPKPVGMVGNHGMHFWVVTRHYLECDQFVHFMKDHPNRDPKEFRYNPGQERSYLGKQVYAEPCPAYRARSQA